MKSKVKRKLEGIAFFVIWYALASVAHCQEISPPGPPPFWPPRYIVRPGMSVTIQLESESCAKPVTALGSTWTCNADDSVTLTIPDDAKPGTYWMYDANDRQIATIEIAPPVLPRPRRHKGIALPGRNDQLIAGRFLFIFSDL